MHAPATLAVIFVVVKQVARLFSSPEDIPYEGDDGY